MRLFTHLPLFAFAALAIACAPAPGTDATYPDAGYDRTAPQLPDDPNNEPIGEVSEDEISDSAMAVSGFATPNLTANQRAQVLAKYRHVDPQNLVADKLLEQALVYFDSNKSKIKNTSVVTVIDFSLPSNKKRMFIINMSSGSVWALHVAHGKGSDSNHDAYAEKFSNTSGSNASSLGMYLAKETYSGSNGYSLRLDGLSSTNSNARRRAVVVHGASYVKDSNVKQGRSWGCPAVSMANRTKVINMIKGGSLMFAGLSK